MRERKNDIDRDAKLNVGFRGPAVSPKALRDFQAPNADRCARGKSFIEELGAGNWVAGSSHHGVALFEVRQDLAQEQLEVLAIDDVVGVRQKRHPIGTQQRTSCCASGL